MVVHEPHPEGHRPPSQSLGTLDFGFVFSGPRVRPDVLGTNRITEMSNPIRSKMEARAQLFQGYAGKLLSSYSQVTVDENPGMAVDRPYGVTVVGKIDGKKATLKFRQERFQPPDRLNAAKHGNLIGPITQFAPAIQDILNECELEIQWDSDHSERMVIMMPVETDASQNRPKVRHLMWEGQTRKDDHIYSVRAAEPFQANPLTDPLTVMVEDRDAATEGDVVEDAAALAVDIGDTSAGPIQWWRTTHHTKEQSQNDVRVDIRYDRDTGWHATRSGRNNALDGIAEANARLAEGALGIPDVVRIYGMLQAAIPPGETLPPNLTFDQRLDRAAAVFRELHVTQEAFNRVRTRLQVLNELESTLRGTPQIEGGTIIMSDHDLITDPRAGSGPSIVTASYFLDGYFQTDNPGFRSYIDGHNDAGPLIEMMDREIVRTVENSRRLGLLPDHWIDQIEQPLRAEFERVRMIQRFEQNGLGQENAEMIYNAVKYFQRLGQEAQIRVHANSNDIKSAVEMQRFNEFVHELLRAEKGDFNILTNALYYLRARHYELQDLVITARGNARKDVEFKKHADAAQEWEDQARELWNMSNAIQNLTNVITGWPTTADPTRYPMQQPSPYRSVPTRKLTPAEMPQAA